MVRRRIEQRRLIAGAHGKTKEPRGQPKLAWYERGEDAPPARLTARQVQILKLAADGMIKKEIAAELGITVNTVRYHFKLMHEKFGTHTALGTYVHVIRAGLLEPPTRLAGRP